MFSRSLRLGLVLAAALAVAPPAFPADPMIPRSPGAQRVFGAFDELRHASALRSPGGPRSVAITDADLNEYVSYRIRSEHASSLKDLQLKFFTGNKVEGMIFLDLAKLGAPAILPSSLRFYFAGKLRVQDSQIKFDVTDLFLERRPVPVFLLNLAFYIASKTQKHGPAGLGDWYKLPLGIKDLTTDPGRLVFHY